jgi:hypothetical protein
MASVKNIIRHIRGIRKNTQPIQTQEETDRIKAAAELARQRVYEGDKIRVRDRNFEKARQARTLALLTIQLEQATEQARQDAIQAQRVKSLRKARRKLSKIRSGE